jgi:hypothetical protein
MNRQRIRVIALAALVVAAGAYVWAQRTGSTVKPAPTANAAVKPGAVKPQAARTAAPVANAKAASAPITPAAKGPAPSPVAASKPPAASAAKTPAAPPVASTPAVVNTKMPARSVSAKPPAASAVATAPVPAAPLVPVAWQDQLQKGTYLGEKLKTRLPDGTDLLVASNGFRDLQQFVSAVAAAHNLQLNFDELKRRVVTDGKGLAHAIDAMRKVASATIEEQRAEYEARGLIQEAKRHPAPAVPAKAATTKTQPKKPARTQSGG